MKTFGVENYGSVDNLCKKALPKPTVQAPRDLLVRVKAASVNPVDIKVRKGTYDYPDYYDHVPRPFQILGYNGSGVVEHTGPQCSFFKVGDKVFYSGSPIRQGSNAEYQLIDERSVGYKPKSLDFTEAATMPLTYVTAYEALAERLEIEKGEKVALLIINGAGGVGAVASQIARNLFNLHCVVTTASRPEKMEFSKNMGATYVVNHHGNVSDQVAKLNLDAPFKLYMETCSKICAPIGKVCSIVQGQANMYGTEFMSKLLSLT